MSKNHTHRRKKRTHSDFEKMHENQLLDWLKNEDAMPNNNGGPAHSYNAIVYVKDHLKAIGLLFHLHTLGYYCRDMWSNPWHIDEMFSLGNRVISIIGNKASFGNVFPEDGLYLKEDEIKERIDKHIKKLDDMVRETPDEEKTCFDKDFLAKPIINCGSNVQLFKVVCEWNNEDIHSKLIVNSKEPERPFLMFPFSNVETIEEYNHSLKDGTVIDWFREATIDDVIEYFNNKGNWNHTPTYHYEQIGDEKRIVPFEMTF